MLILDPENASPEMREKFSRQEIQLFLAQTGWRTDSEMRVEDRMEM